MSERAGVVPARAAVRAQADAVLAALDRLLPDAREALAEDPRAVLESWPAVVVRDLQGSAGPSGRCDVAGAYIGTEDPPVIVIAPALSHGREAFTALHELGHHLQNTELELMDAIATPVLGKALEEASCNLFAANLLIPAATVAQHLADGVTARDVAMLASAVQASRSAVCVAASQHLKSPGHVVLLDGNGDVVIDAAVGEPPLRRGSHQGERPVVREALSRTSHHAEGITRLAYRDGIVGRELYAQSADVDGYLVLVAVTDHAPWQRFAPTTAVDGPTARWNVCEHCGEDFQTWNASCPRCGRPVCPECRRCGCAVASTRRCTKCWLELPLATFDGDSERCESCA